MKTTIGIFFVLACVCNIEAQIIAAAKEKYNELRSRLKCADIPNNGTCAILFDKEDCTGWQLAINEGHTELPSRGFVSVISDGARKNDAEAVLVRDGCVFVGYDHDKGDSRGLGKAVVIAAIDGNTYQSFDDDAFEDLNEEISSCDCVCSGFAFSKPAGK